MVVTSAAGVGAHFEHRIDPGFGLRDFMPAPELMKECEGVDACSSVESGPVGGEVGMEDTVAGTEVEHLVHESVGGGGRERR